MEYNIDEKNYRIEIKGSKKEIRKFARCLVEVINKFYLFDLKSTKLTEEPIILNPTGYERILLSNTSLYYSPNVNDIESKKTHFYIVKLHYEKAKEKFENH